MAVGSADIFSAVESVWNANGLNTTFKAYWPTADRTKYAAINETEGEGNHPYPYCIFDLMPGKVQERMTGGSDTNQVLRDVPCRFKVFAKDNGENSCKQIAATLAEAVLVVFGGHPTQRPKFDNYALTHGHVLLCQYQTEAPAKIDVEVYCWVINYLLKLDVPFKV